MNGFKIDQTGQKNIYSAYIDWTNYFRYVGVNSLRNGQSLLRTDI